MSTSAAEIAFRELYAQYHASVLAYCLRRTGGADAHDATAEVFTIAWRKRDDLPDDDKVLVWLYGVAYKVLGHQWRSLRRRGRLSTKVAGLRVLSEPGPEAVVVQRAEDRRVVAAARQLSRRDREILMLAGWEELPHGQIAERLGISVAAVDQRFHRAKERLARQYDRLSGSPARAQEGEGA